MECSDALGVECGGRKRCQRGRASVVHGAECSMQCPSGSPKVTLPTCLVVDRYICVKTALIL